MLKSLAVTTALLSAAACNNVTYTNPGTTPSGVVTAQTGHFFIGGLVGHTDVWANRMCPHGVAGVHTKFSFVDEVLTLITVFIYAPRTYLVECAQ